MSLPIPAFVKSIFSTFPLYVYEDPVAEEQEDTLFVVDGDRRGLAAEVSLRRAGVPYRRCAVSPDGGSLFLHGGQQVPLEGITALVGSASLKNRDGGQEGGKENGLGEALDAVLARLSPTLVDRAREVACLDALVDTLDAGAEAHLYALVHLASPAERAVLRRHGPRLVALHDRLHADERLRALDRTTTHTALQNQDAEDED